MMPYRIPLSSAIDLGARFSALEEVEIAYRRRRRAKGYSAVQSHLDAPLRRHFYI